MYLNKRKQPHFEIGYIIKCRILLLSIIPIIESKMITNTKTKVFQNWSLKNVELA